MPFWLNPPGTLKKLILAPTRSAWAARFRPPSIAKRAMHLALHAHSDRDFLRQAGQVSDRGGSRSSLIARFPSRTAWIQIDPFIALPVLHPIVLPRFGHKLAPKKCRIATKGHAAVAQELLDGFAILGRLQRYSVHMLPHRSIFRSRFGLYCVRGFEGLKRGFLRRLLWRGRRRERHLVDERLCGSACRAYRRRTGP